MFKCIKVIDNWKPKYPIKKSRDNSVDPIASVSASLYFVDRLGLTNQTEIYAHQNSIYFLEILLMLIKERIGRQSFWE